MKKIFDIDFFGMCASFLCLLHCLFLPWLLAIAGTYFGSMISSPAFHDVMLVLAILLGLPVFIFSFLKYKSKAILFTGVLGLALTTFGTVQETNCCPAEAACDSQTACTSEKNFSNEQVCSSGTVCASEAECEVKHTASAEKSEFEVQAALTPVPELIQTQGFNTVPIGVTLLILAHFMNFRKKRICRNECCK